MSEAKCLIDGQLKKLIVSTHFRKLSEENKGVEQKRKSEFVGLLTKQKN